jgi:hypothetical protein
MMASCSQGVNLVDEEIVTRIPLGGRIPSPLLVQKIPHRGLDDNSCKDRENSKSGFM